MRASITPRYAVIDNFLTSDEHTALMDYIFRRRTDFQRSEVASDESTDPYRACSILADAEIRDLPAAAKIHAVALGDLGEWICGRPFAPRWGSWEIVASGPGDRFRRHLDLTDEYVWRRFTFLLYLHTHPRRFTGGTLRLYGYEGPHVDTTDAVVDIDPKDNRLVVFSTDTCWHEVIPVEADSEDFAHSRFTLNGELGVVAPYAFTSSSFAAADGPVPPLPPGVEPIHVGVRR